VAATLNLTIDCGVTWRRVLVWADADGARRSLAGMSARLQVRADADAPVMIELSSADSSLLIEEDAVDDDTTGTLTVIFSGPATANVRTERTEYDILLLTEASEDGEPSSKLVGGTITFTRMITRRASA